MSKHSILYIEINFFNMHSILKKLYFVQYQKAENQDVLNCPFKKNLKEEEKNQALFCTLLVQNTIYRSHYSALWDF